MVRYMSIRKYSRRLFIKTSFSSMAFASERRWDFPVANVTQGESSYNHTTLTGFVFYNQIEFQFSNINRDGIHTTGSYRAEACNVLTREEEDHVILQLGSTFFVRWAKQDLTLDTLTRLISEMRDVTRFANNFQQFQMTTCDALTIIKDEIRQVKADQETIFEHFQNFENPATIRKPENLTPLLQKLKRGCLDLIENNDGANSSKHARIEAQQTPKRMSSGTVMKKLDLEPENNLMADYNCLVCTNPSSTRRSTRSSNASSVIAKTVKKCELGDKWFCSVCATSYNSCTNTIEGRVCNGPLLKKVDKVICPRCGVETSEIVVD